MILQPGATSWNKLSEERKRAYRDYLRRERGEKDALPAAEPPLTMEELHSQRLRPLR